MRSSGFTLIELMLAIAVTGVVALLVYGAADAAIDTRSRLEARGRETRARQAWQAVVEDALRNARPATAFDDSAFVVVDAADGRGRPRDRLWFVTAGGLPPLTADTDWEVLIAPTPRGLSLVARPVGVNAPPRRLVAPDGVTGLDVRVLSTDPEAPGWIDDWQRPRFVPRAIELVYWTDEGPAGAPVRLTLPLGMAP